MNNDIKNDKNTSVEELTMNEQKEEPIAKIKDVIEKEVLDKLVAALKIDKLLEELKNENWEVRANAAEKLGKMGIKAAKNKVLDELQEIATKDENSNVREKAALALRNIKEKVLEEDLKAAREKPLWMIFPHMKKNFTKNKKKNKILKY